MGVKKFRSKAASSDEDDGDIESSTPSVVPQGVYPTSKKQKKKKKPVQPSGLSFQNDNEEVKTIIG